MVERVTKGMNETSFREQIFWASNMNFVWHFSLYNFPVFSIPNHISVFFVSRFCSFVHSIGECHDKWLSLNVEKWKDIFNGETNDSMSRVHESVNEREFISARIKTKDKKLLQIVAGVHCRPVTFICVWTYSRWRKCTIIDSFSYLMRGQRRPKRKWKLVCTCMFAHVCSNACRAFIWRWHQISSEYKLS